MPACKSRNVNVEPAHCDTSVAAQFCKMYDIPFFCLKAVSDNLDGNLKDWRSILADIRVRFTELLNEKR